MLYCHTNVKTDARGRLEVETIKMGCEGLDSEVGGDFRKVCFGRLGGEAPGRVTQALQEV